VWRQNICTWHRTLSITVITTEDDWQWRQSAGGRTRLTATVGKWQASGSSLATHILRRSSVCSPVQSGCAAYWNRTGPSLSHGLPAGSVTSSVPSCVVTRGSEPLQPLSALTTCRPIANTSFNITLWFTSWSFKWPLSKMFPITVKAYVHPLPLFLRVNRRTIP